MPRWNRREKPDYRHLRDVTDEAALVNAIRSPTYGEGHDYRLLAGFQARLVAMWGDRDLLALDELVPAHEEVRARDPGFFGYGRNWQGAFLHDAVGNLVGWGLRLGVLQEEAADGARAFRMVRRAPVFEKMGNGRWRRIDAVPGRSERGAAKREAYRVKHAEKVAPAVRELVGRLCAAGMPIPNAWFTRYPDQFARLKGLAAHVANARPTFEDAHRGMHLADQKAWLADLDRCARIMAGSEMVRDHFLRKLQAEGAPAPEVPADDIEALGTLA
ncbi:MULTISPECIES: hypothetical protein [unclassified Methylobacterium]|uniref:hypothetical protein n=1 Tax=unclassified Methylobacterium TaxID=2615210 RepID=UPI000CC85389|nr:MULTISPECIES: hypothetical protein [unclassified Methylobacterium]PIU06663.1 MAG: hypothetical protein COT56_08505 [Methylobacterium sp. CG09_land_8_20_14_0_10_71_15]PIU12077.1 MAG: hypothetical protein COT28_16740 [Methylobacterium sp. CG08_land_8_20_14_0_20_71_15]GBU19239.1 hypothetical protein AwMethylo_34540 [Methylobacterium sp.]